MPADFVADLQADFAAIDGKKSEQTDDRLDDIGDTAHKRALVKEARGLIKSLGTSVKNRCRRDSEILAEWATASRLPHPPHRWQWAGGNGIRGQPHPAWIGGFSGVAGLGGRHLVTSGPWTGYG